MKILFSIILVTASFNVFSADNKCEEGIKACVKKQASESKQCFADLEPVCKEKIAASPLKACEADMNERCASQKSDTKKLKACLRLSKNPACAKLVVADKPALDCKINFETDPKKADADKISKNFEKFFQDHPDCIRPKSVQ
jgi:hypothetical protein